MSFVSSVVPKSVIKKSSSSTRWKCVCAYDGGSFNGWQSQAGANTIQDFIERDLRRIFERKIRIEGSGRTDAGVHARCQVVHFDSQAARSERAWVLGANSRLARDVAVLWACPVSDEFHARFGARARRYRYTILNRPMRAALRSRYVTWERTPLDVDAMQRAAQALIGEHDFSAFRTAACQANSPNRNVREITISRRGDEIAIDIEANAFLHHMVRNIVGSLLPIGRGERGEAWLAELLHGRDRSVAGPTAPATGLTFLAPRYPAQWNLPIEVCL